MLHILARFAAALFMRGSTWLCDMLRRAGAGDPAEWWHTGRTTCAAEGSRWRLRRQSCRESGTVARLVELGPDRVIRLRRHDRVAQAVSLYCARVTDQWELRVGQQRAEPPVYDFAAIGDCLGLIQQQEAALDAVVTDSLDVWYEDLAADPQAVLQRVLAYLGECGASPADCFRQPTSDLEIQRDERTIRYADRFRAERSQQQ